MKIEMQIYFMEKTNSSSLPLGSLYILLYHWTYGSLVKNSLPSSIRVRLGIEIEVGQL